VIWADPFYESPDPPEIGASYVDATRLGPRCYWLKAVVPLRSSFSYCL
jgi:hypothetical protein